MSALLTLRALCKTLTTIVALEATRLYGHPIAGGTSASGVDTAERSAHDNGH